MYKHAGVGRICDNFNFRGCMKSWRSLPQEASPKRVNNLWTLSKAILACLVIHVAPVGRYIHQLILGSVQRIFVGTKDLNTMNTNFRMRPKGTCFSCVENYHIDQRLLFINNMCIYCIYIHTVHCKPTKCARLPLPTTPINKPLPRSQQMLRCPLSRLSLRIFHGLMGNESLIKIHSATGGFFWNPCWPNPRLPDQFHQWSKGIIQ